MWPASSSAKASLAGAAPTAAAAPAVERSAYLVVGRIVGLYGVGGWVKVHSYTQPRDNLLQYSPWYARMEPEQEWQVLQWSKSRRCGKGIVAELDGCSDRDRARLWLGADIAITRSQLPEIDVGEHYWADLLGSRVVTARGVELGVVASLLETGANDVLVVRGSRERLIPFVLGVYVMSIDRECRCIVVDWEEGY